MENNRHKPDNETRLWFTELLTLAGLAAVFWFAVAYSATNRGLVMWVLGTIVVGMLCFELGANWQRRHTQKRAKAVENRLRAKAGPQHLDSDHDRHRHYLDGMADAMAQLANNHKRHD